MSRDYRIPSQLRRLARNTTSDEIKDHRWWKLQERHIAELNVDDIECALLRDRVIAECKRQNGGTR